MLRTGPETPSSRFPNLAQSRKAWNDAFGPLPDDYVCFDVETLGPAPFNFVCQIGWCRVLNRSPVLRGSCRLSWEDVLPEDRKTLYLSKAASSGRRRWSKAVPLSPPSAVDEFQSVLAGTPGPAVGFNAWAFDVPLLTKECSDLGRAWSPGPWSVIDVGVMVKSSAGGPTPRRGETYQGSAARCLSSGKRSIKWSLHDTWYGTVKPEIPPGEEFHDADTDAFLTHIALEWFRGR